jgi:formylglycine-generating enzyme required for sulfatase activity
VGSHPEDVSPYGVLDMAGNLGEWTQSPLVAYPGHVNPRLLFNPELRVERGALAYQKTLWAGALTMTRAWGADLAGFRCVAGDEPQWVAEVVVSYEPMVPPPPPTATAVDVSEMVEIPAGEFLRGVDEQNIETYLREYSRYRFVNQEMTKDIVEHAYADARPQRSVYLDRYYIDRYPVTTAEFVEFLKVLGEHRWSCGGWRCAGFGGGEIGIDQGQYVALTRYETYPIPSATWQGAQAYCAWQGKRLPTEVEWEKAARGTDGRLYPWGNEWDPRVREHAKMIAAKDPIGSKPYLASPYGVEDLLGVSASGEWVADWYAEDYYNRPDSTHNPQGATELDERFKDESLDADSALQLLETAEKVRRGRGTDWGIPVRYHVKPMSEIYGGLITAEFRCVYTPPEGQ